MPVWVVTLPASDPAFAVFPAFDFLDLTFVLHVGLRSQPFFGFVLPFGWIIVGGLGLGSPVNSSFD